MTPGPGGYLMTPFYAILRIFFDTPSALDIFTMHANSPHTYLAYPYVFRGIIDCDLVMAA